MGKAELDNMEKRYLGLVDVLKNTLIIDHKKRPYAHEILENHFNEVDYVHFQPLPASNRSSNSNRFSQPRSRFSAPRERSSHARGFDRSSSHGRHNNQYSNYNR